MKSLWLLMPLFSMVYGCTPTLKVETKLLSVSSQKDSFPISWFGRWKGNLEIYNAKGLKQTVPMMLIMDKTDTAGIYKWHIQYGEDTAKGLRPYLLRTIDVTKGLYVCDELNSIRMTRNIPFKICVDGGETEDVIDDSFWRGADEVVIGRRLFNGDLAVNIKRMQEAAVK